MPRPRRSVCVAAVLVTLAPATAVAAQPGRLWSTYVGGTHNDTARALGVDAAGHVFVAINTNSDDLGTPGTEAPESFADGDIVLFKFAPDGTRLWSTYVGAGGFDYCNGLAVDGAGNSVIVGYTDSQTGIATPGAPQTTLLNTQDGMAIRHDASGKRVWGTYLGSTSQADLAAAVAMDPASNAYVGGTVGAAFPFALPAGPHDTSYNAGPLDGYVVKLTPAGKLAWGTYYGGTNNDQIRGVAVVGADIVYASGDTFSSVGIDTLGSGPSGGGDAFLVRFDAAGVRQWGTYFGGDAAENAAVLAAGADSVYLAGFTESKLGLSTAGAHQIAPGFGEDGWLARFVPSGQLDWATYYGGTDADRVHGVAVDPEGDAWIVGSSGSPDSIASPDALQPSRQGSVDLFVARFDPSGERQWGTYLGGEQGESYGDVLPVGTGTAYVAAETTSTMGITDHALFQPQFGGGSDGFLVRLTEDLGVACQNGGDCDGGLCVEGICCDAPCGGDCQACSVAQGAPIDGLCGFLGESSICRPAASACDVAEVCSGAADCPEDVAEDDGAPCDDGVCEAGVCVPEMTSSTTDASTSTTAAETSTTGTTGTSSGSTSDASGTTSAPTTSGATTAEPGTGSTSTSAGGASDSATDATTEPAQSAPGGCGCRPSAPVPRDIFVALLALLAVRRGRRGAPRARS